MTGACWDELGITETTDTHAIRKAYARRLKAIDPETDPASFIRLREAFDQAVDWATWEKAEAEWDLLHGDGAPVGPLPEASQPEGVPDAQSPDDDLLSSAIPFDALRFADPYAAHEPAGSNIPPELHELDRILYDAQPETPPEAGRLVSLARRILDDPAMDRIDHAEMVQSWLARLIVDTAPFSDPIAPLAVSHFHWEKQEGSWDRDWDVALILQRRQALKLVDALSRPTHRYHGVWHDLTSSNPKLGMERFGIRTDVRDFLYDVRQRTPQVEDFLNAERVALWDRSFSDPNVGRSWSRLGLCCALVLGGIHVFKLFAG